MYKRLGFFASFATLALVVGCGGPLPTESEEAALEQSSAELGSSEPILGYWKSDGWTVYMDWCTDTGWLTTSPAPPECNQVGQVIFSNLAKINIANGAHWYSADRKTWDGLTTCGQKTIRVAIGVYSDGKMREYEYGSQSVMRTWIR